MLYQKIMSGMLKYKKMAKPAKIIQPRLTSSWEQLIESARLSLANYEVIGWFFLLPGLLVSLGKSYWGNLQDSSKRLKFIHGPHETLGLVLMSVGFAIMIVNYVPSLLFRLEVAEQTKTRSILSYYRLGIKTYLRVWIVEIVSYLMYLIGFLLFIVPGLFILPRVGLSPYAAMDDQQSTIGSIFKRTNKISKPFSNSILATYMVMLLVGTLPGIIYGINEVAAIVFILIGYLTMFMPALRYREVKSASRK